LTEEAYRGGDLPPYQAQIKKGSRYVTIKRFDDEHQAFIWLKEYVKEHHVRGRIKV
jgi:hypothetical protein